MVEHKDADDGQRAVRLCNSGLLVARSDALFELLGRVGNDNAQGEYYLPEIVNIAVSEGRHCAVIVTSDPDEVAGINSRSELAEAEARWQKARRARAMADGATLIAPETVFFSWDTVLGRDVTVEPNVVFGPGVEVADQVVIHAFTHLEGARLASGASVGPFARLRRAWPASSRRSCRLSPLPPAPRRGAGGRKARPRLRSPAARPRGG